MERVCVKPNQMKTEFFLRFASIFMVLLSTFIAETTAQGAYQQIQLPDGNYIALFDNGTWAPINQTNACQTHELTWIHQISNLLEFSFDYQQDQWLDKQTSLISEHEHSIGKDYGLQAVHQALQNLTFSFPYQKINWANTYIKKIAKSRLNTRQGSQMRSMVEQAEIRHFSFPYQKQNWIENKLDELLNQNQ